jgi:hypothetical protein
VLNPLSIFNSIRNFLFSRANREFLLFLCFLALASVFWLMIRLNETYEVEVKTVVKYVNVPKQAVLTSGDTDTLRVTISDKGFYVLTYVYSQKRTPLTIDFSQYSKQTSSGMGTVSNSDLQKLLASKLPTSTKIISVKPDKLVFYYNDGVSKRVPVVWHGNVKPQQLYFVANTRIEPDSVTVYASKQKLDSIKVVYTEELDYTDFRDTLNITASLTTKPGVKVVPNRVSISFITDVLTEGKIDGIPIEGINMPEGKVLRTFPSKLGVRFVTGMKNYQGLTSDDFRIVADYKEFSETPSSKCNVVLVAKPEGVSNVRLEADQVDYLIEEKQ